VPGVGGQMTEGGGRSGGDIVSEVRGRGVKWTAEKLSHRWDAEYAEFAFFIVFIREEGKQ